MATTASPPNKPAARKNTRTNGSTSKARAKSLLDAAAAPAAAGELPLTSIDPDHFTNPRGPVDRKSPGFLELVASIKDRGVLQPIVVGPALVDGGRHPIVAGWRRYAAATAAKLKAIPVRQVTTTEAKEALVDALAENVAREDMTPLAEARAIDTLMREHGYTQVQAGKAIGMAERTVRERLRLLKLHTEAPVVGEAIDKGDVPMDAAVLLQQIAKVAPKMTAAMVAGVNNDVVERMTDPWSASDLAKPAEVDQVIEWLQESAHDPDVIEALGEIEELYSWTGEHCRISGRALALTDEQRERWEQIPPEQTWNSHPPGFPVTQADVDAARAAGQLLEIEGTTQWASRRAPTWIAGAFFTSEWIEDRLQTLEKAGKARKAAAEKARKQQAVETGKTGVAKDLTAGQRDAAEKAKAAEQRDREIAHHRNALLGERSAGGTFEAVALSLPAAKFLALLALENHQARRLADRGLRYCDAQYLTEEERKNGTTKRTYAQLHEDRIREQILAATTPAEAIAPVLRAYALARLADEKVVAQSNRSWWSLPGDSRIGGGEGTGHFLAELLDLTGLERDLNKEAEQRADAGKPLAAVLDDKPATSPAADPALKGKTINDQVVALVNAHPGITIPELADKLNRKQNYLYRVLPGLATANRVVKQGRGWHPVEAAS